MRENGPWHKRPAPCLQAPHGQTTERQPVERTSGFNTNLTVPLLDEAWDDLPELEQLLGDRHVKTQNIHPNDL